MFICVFRISGISWWNVFAAIKIWKDAKELMKALLHRDPAKRLGAGHKGYEELKDCRDFFCGVIFFGWGIFSQGNESNQVKLAICRIIPSTLVSALTSESF